MSKKAWTTVFAISGAACFGFVLWGINQFLSLRGVVHVLASRIVLVATAAVAILGLFSFTRLFAKWRNISFWAGSVIVVLLGAFLDWWAPRPIPEELTGYMQLASVNVVTKLLAENKPVSLNVGFTANGSQPISGVYLFQQAAIADYHKQPDEKTDREAEEYLHRQFDEEIPKQERLIAEKKMNGLNVPIGVGLLWRTVNTTPLTKSQVKGLISGESRLYLLTWTKWKDSRDHTEKLITCSWFQTPTSVDLSKEQKVWHLCTWW